MTDRRYARTVHTLAKSLLSNTGVNGVVDLVRARQRKSRQRCACTGDSALVLMRKSHKTIARADRSLRGSVPISALLPMMQHFGYRGSMDALRRDLGRFEAEGLATTRACRSGRCGMTVCVRLASRR